MATNSSNVSEREYRHFEALIHVFEEENCCFFFFSFFLFLFFFFVVLFLFCFCCAFLLTCQHNLFTETWYLDTPKFYNPIPNTDSSFTKFTQIKVSRPPNPHTEFFTTCFNRPHLPTHSNATQRGPADLQNSWTQPPNNNKIYSHDPKAPTTWTERSRLLHNLYTLKIRLATISPKHPQGPPRHPRRLITTHTH